MNIKRLVLLIFIVSLASNGFAVSINQLLKEGRVPAIKDKKLNLSGLHIDSLEGLAQIPGIETVEVLALNDNDLKEIVRGSFAACKSLKSVGLRNNKISLIEPYAFDGTQLQAIILNRNNLATFEDNAFAGPAKLALLSINNNPASKQELQKLQKALPNTKITKGPITGQALIAIGVATTVILLALAAVVGYSAWQKKAEEARGRREPGAAAPSVAPAEVVRAYPRGSVGALPEAQKQIVDGSLDLSDKNLTSLEGLESIQNPEKVTELSLSFNQLTALPDTIFDKFTKLEGLYLNNNKLEALPNGIGNLTKLESLFLSHNQLTTLPDGISNLTNLKTLYLSNNQLTTLPDGIGRLTNLKWLSLSHNQLMALPNGISNLTNLEWLYLNNNRLTALPAAISNLRKLKTLDLYNNDKLTKFPKLPSDAFPNLPPEAKMIFGIPPQGSIGALPAEEKRIINGKLDLSNKNLTSLAGFETIPDVRNITVLDLSHNQLKTFPQLFDLGNYFTKLKSLDLRYNDIPSLEQYIFDQGFNALENLYLDYPLKLSILYPMRPQLKVFYRITQLPQVIQILKPIDISAAVANALKIRGKQDWTEAITVSPYEILGVQPGANKEEISKAHRELSRVWHPDKHKIDKELANEVVKAINNAHDVFKPQED